MVLGILFGLVLPLAVVAAVVAAGARAARGRDVDWGTVVRQFFQHVVAVALAFVAAIGLTELLAVALSGPPMVEDAGTLAGSVAFAVVGVPGWVAVTWWLLGQARRDPVEAASLAWSLHLAVLGVVSLAMVVSASFDLTDGLAAGAGWRPEAVATLLVWGMLWAWARWLEHRGIGSPRWAIVQVVAGSAIGLGVLAVGAVRLLAAALDTLLFDRVVLVAMDPWAAVTGIVVGGAAWAVYWLVDGLRRPRDGWWHAWVLLGGVLTGLVTAIASAGTVLWLVAVWLVGDPAGSAVRHFDDLPLAVASGVVGLAVWAYHRAVLGPRGERARTELDRVSDLLLAAVGLLAAAGGFATIVVAVLEVVAGPGTVEVGTDPINTLLAAVVFLALGLPVWWQAWSRVQRVARAAPLGGTATPVDLDEAAVAERESTARRVYLFGLFGVGGVAALVTVLITATTVFEDLFEGTLGVATLYEVRIALAVLVTAAAVAWVHWRIHRDDRAVVPTGGRRFPARLTLVGAADPDVAEALADATGAAVTLWRRTDGAGPPWAVDTVTDLLEGRTESHVVVVAQADGPQVIPVET